jgi:hypothetical protein
MAGSAEAANRIPLTIRIMTPSELLGREIRIILGYELKVA